MVGNEKSVHTAIADITIEDGIMICRVHVQEITLPLIQQHANELEEHYSELFPIPCIIENHPNAKALTKEVRDFLGSERMTRAASRLALVVQSSFRKIMANLFLKIMRSNLSVQLFTDIEQAKIWAKNK